MKSVSDFFWDCDDTPLSQFRVTFHLSHTELHRLKQNNAVGFNPGVKPRVSHLDRLYSVQEWAGIRVDDLLDAAGDIDDDAAYVRFTSVTGYRWSLPIEEAEDALLATHVGGERLSHGHGAPARLVAPDRRGFQWVKWVTRVEVRSEYDFGQWIVTLVSGFD
ncbi:hypothetical protein DJ77_09125 [Halorubrum ezzemoulense]|nr:hypothetical protein DJ77_09125 [Halorubrum ezzemoulense]